MIFINTRPKNRAQLLSDALQYKGLTVFNLPLLKLEPINISQREQQYHQAFYQSTNNYQMLVVVSPTAARMGLANCPKGFVPKITVIAVGHKTANVLRQAGWQVRCPDEYSNEGMMRMEALSVLGKGHQVLIWRGQGGRRLLVDYLQNNNVVVHAIAWYLRRCPGDLFESFKRLQLQLAPLYSQDNVSFKPPMAKQITAKPIVLMSSGEAFNNWRGLFAEDSLFTEDKSFAESKDNHVQVDQIQANHLKKTKPHFQLADFQYLTFGKRLTGMLTDLKLTCVRVEHLDVDEIWRGVELLTMGR